MQKKTKYETLTSRVAELEEEIVRLRKLLEKQAVAEKQFRNSQRLARLGSWAWNVRTGAVQWSQEIYCIFGLDPQSFQPQVDAIARLLHPEDRKIHESVMQQAMMRHEQYTFRARILMPDDRVRFVISTSEGHYDSRGNLSHISGIIQDITDQKRSEKKLEEQLNFMQKLIDAIPISIFYKDTDGIYRGCNDAYAEFLGKSKSQIIDKGVHEVFPKTLAERYYEMDRRLFEEPGIQHYEAQMSHSDGTRHDVLFNKATYEDADGKVMGLIGTMLDITNRKRAENALQESEERFRNTFEQAAVGICHAESSGRFLRVNRRFCEIVGYTQQELLGLTWQEITHPDDMKTDLVKAQQVRANQIQTYSMEKRFVRKDASIVWSNLTVSMVRDPDGNPKYFIGVIEDITRRKNMEEQLRQSHKTEAIGTLSGGIAHDFNNILSIILGNAELAAYDIPEWNPALHKLEEIRTACLRAKDVVMQLLSFSRKTQQGRTPVKLQHLIRESLKLLRASIPASIEIRTHISDDTRMISADPTQIQQVLINLCSNAVHAMEENGGILTIRLDDTVLLGEMPEEFREVKPGRYIRLTVADNGHGISPDIRQRIFDPYFTTKEIGKGTGIGLASVHGIVKNHDGAISVQSEPGKGSTMRVIFPAADEADV